MRARIGLAIVIVVVLVAGALAASQRFSGDATAQEDAEEPAALPIFYAEIAGWCADGCAPAFADLPDGYVRAVIADLTGASQACQPMALPEDVEGWALVRADGEQATPTAGEIVALDDLRQTPDAAICELIVSRR